MRTPQEPTGQADSVLNEDPYRMSFAELAVQLSITQAGSPRAMTMEGEIRRRLGKESAKLAPLQLAIAMVTGALIAVAAFYFGATMRIVPAHDHPGHSARAKGAERTPPDLRRE